MVRDLGSVLSENVKSMKKSAIRELLKLTADKEIISFAGGLPAPESFPIDDLKDVINDLMNNKEEAQQALQYGSTEGDAELRQLIAENYNKKGFEVTVDNVIITTASQQGLDLLAKIFINPGDKIVVGMPSYLGALGAFNAYRAKPVGVPLDEMGMIPEKLEEVLMLMKKVGEKPKFIYVIPDFQNPAGITMPTARRKEIIKIAKKYDVLIVEDSPYKELRFEGEHQASLYALDKTGHIITFGTFSKIFLPGFRIGWVIAHPDVVDKFVVAKQATDLCTSPFVQRITAKYIKSGKFDENLQKTIQSYKEKRNIMLDAFEKYMPKGVTWTHPKGGLFLFLNLPEYLNAEVLFHKAVKKKVAFVIGSVFHYDGSGTNTMRINFSYVSKEKNLEGVKRLAQVIKDEIDLHKE